MSAEPITTIDIWMRPQGGIRCLDYMDEIYDECPVCGAKRAAERETEGA